MYKLPRLKIVHDGQFQIIVDAETGIRVMPEEVVRAYNNLATRCEILANKDDDKRSK